MPYKDRCVTMYGGRVEDKKGRVEKKQGVADEGGDGDKELEWKTDEKMSESVERRWDKGQIKAIN